MGATIRAAMFTGLLIALLAVVGAATLVGGGLALLSRRSSPALPDADRRQLGDGHGDAEARLLERPINAVRINDIIQYQTRDFLVEGVVEYDEDGHKWRAARLVDGKDERWLLIGLERGGAVSLRLVEVDPDIHLSGYPPEQLIVAGQTFRQESRGTATARAHGDAGPLPGAAETTPAESVLRCRWWRYETAGSQVLVVEQWGGLFRALRGEMISAHDLEMMPGS
jgi:hypothetical protein